jgi:RNA polymerase sigma factor (TIGR02999 family)
VGESPDELASQLLHRLADGDHEVEGQVFALLYDDLKLRAQALMRHQPAAHTLQPTALVHEAWLKLADNSLGGAASRTHFFKVAARAMRSVLVDHARAHATDKRGGAAAKQSIEADEIAIDGPSGTLLLLDEALTRLQAADPDLARIAELRLFGGLSHGEIAEALDISPRTAERAWKLARAWLQRDLGNSHSG